MINNTGLNWPIRSITRVLYHQLTWYNSLLLWRWLPHRLSKRRSVSTTTVLFRTTFTRTTTINLLMKWLLGSNLSQRTVSQLIHFIREVEDRESYDNVSPHQTKGMTSDSDNQIPTDYLLYNRIFNLWGQLSIILNRFNLFKRLTLITVLSSKSRVTCTPVASMSVGACCPILTGVFGTFINVYA